jgi:nicotinate-nucleotide adenylyltransferase
VSTGDAKRIGIFGGSFDPVHLGHLVAAQDACEHMLLDRVLFVPAAQAPLKGIAPRLDGVQRLALLRVAVAGDPRFELSTVELDRGGVNYSIDTARALCATDPAARWYWIIGADQAARLAEWRQIAELGALVEFIVLARPGFAGEPRDLPPTVRLHVAPMHVFDVSSSEIRDRLAASRPVRHFLPASVAELIERHHLYR